MIIKRWFLWSFLAADDESRRSVHAMRRWRARWTTLRQDSKLTRVLLRFSIGYVRQKFNREKIHQSSTNPRNRSERNDKIHHWLRKRLRRSFVFDAQQCKVAAARDETNQLKKLLLENSLFSSDIDIQRTTDRSSDALAHGFDAFTELSCGTLKQKFLLTAYFERGLYMFHVNIIIAQRFNIYGRPTFQAWSRCDGEKNSCTYKWRT